MTIIIEIGLEVTHDGTLAFRWVVPVRCGG